MSENVQKTPLNAVHKESGATMVEFGGWEMPIRYPMGIVAEHKHVREKVGLFDVSHMGEFRVRGPKSLETLEWITTNSVESLKAGEAHYALFPNAAGGIVDDLIVYCLEPGEDYLLCVNAANIDKDFVFVQENNRGALLENQSDLWGQIAIQGPKAPQVLETLLGGAITLGKPFTFQKWEFRGAECIVAMTGYTGELGCEIFVPRQHTEALWKALVAIDPEVLPIGLGARDSLRTEMKYSLYGHEITDSTNPYEAGLGWVVKPKAKDFLGRDKMLAAKEAGLGRKLVGLKVLGRGIARQGYKAFSFDNEEIGEVTSGTLSPSLNTAIAIAYVSESAAKVGTKLFVEIRNKKVEAEVVQTPFYKK